MENNNTTNRLSSMDLQNELAKKDKVIYELKAKIAAMKLARQKDRECLAKEYLEARLDNAFFECGATDELYQAAHSVARNVLQKIHMLTDDSLLLELIAAYEDLLKAREYRIARFAYAAAVEDAVSTTAFIEEYVLPFIKSSAFNTKLNGSFCLSSGESLDELLKQVEEKTNTNINDADF